MKFAENVSQQSLAEQMSRIPGVYEVIVISGEWDIALKVRAGSVEEIGTLVVDKLRMMKGIEKTQTCVAFQTIKEGFQARSGYPEFECGQMCKIQITPGPNRSGDTSFATACAPILRSDRNRPLNRLQGLCV